MLACFSQSTAHGLVHIGNERTVFGKLVWLLLTTAAFVLLGNHTYSLYSQLLDEKVFVSTQPEALEFIQPDIVFCSERIFARDYINNPPEDEREYMLNVSRSIQDFDKIYRNWTHKSSRIIWDSLNFHRLYTAFYHRKRELFLNITCNADPIDLSHLKVEMSITHFACYRLSSEICKLDSPFKSLIIKFYIHIYGRNINYTNLNIKIDNKRLDSFRFIQKEYSDDVADGMHVYFVQPNEAIHERTTRVVASAGIQTDIRIKSTKNVRRSTEQRRCQEVIKYNQFYNLLFEDLSTNHLNFTENSLCIYKQFQYMFYRMFQCLSKQLPIPTHIDRSTKFCGDIRRQKEFIGTLYINITFQKLYRAGTLTKECEGTIPCSTVEHEVSVNYNTWPWESTLQRLLGEEIPGKLSTDLKNCSCPGLREAISDFENNPSNVRSWQSNFLKVSIASDEFMSTLVEESPSHTWINFLSDVGGIIGFYMGASLITLCELLRVLYKALVSMMSSKR